jgi:Na+/H+ antiporter NhaD/arsenite permease-like protein
MILAVFALVYVGMFLGGFPGIRVDRTGIALLGAIALLVTETVPLDRAVAYVDLPTLALLFAMMVLSAQLKLGGVYAALTRRVGSSQVGAAALLALVMALVGTLSAVFTNDIVALAVAPAVVQLCRERDLDPVPFLLGVACAANVGSAATLIGNPQNILVGQALRLSFSAYATRAAVPAALGLVASWAVVVVVTRKRWGARTPRMDQVPSPARRPFDAWQAAKGLALGAAVMAAFLFTGWPRELVGLAAAAVVLSGRRFHSREMLGLVDWQLLVLFIGLFVVNGALADAGLAARGLEALARVGVDPRRPAWLFAVSVALSNVVSNVPAVMLLLPVAHGARDGAVLAMSSTLAGNLLVVGSIANIIVLEEARAAGVTIGWRDHSRVGVPVTLVTLALAAAALAVG